MAPKFQCKRGHHSKAEANIIGQEVAEIIGMALLNYASDTPSLEREDEVCIQLPLSLILVIFIVLSSYYRSHHISNCVFRLY